MAAHYHTKNLRIENNVIFNSNRGIAFSGLEGTPYTAEDVVIAGNTFYDIGYSTKNSTGYCVIFNDAKDITFEGNTIVGIDKASYWLSIGSEAGTISEHVNVSCNAIISSEKETGTRGNYTSLQYNTFYNTTKIKGCDGADYPNASDAKMEDLTFTSDRYTNTPYEIVIPGVLASGSSPHMKSCFFFSPKRAGVPDPQNGETNISTSTILSWLKVSDADSYDIYFGSSYPPAFIKNQTEITFDPGELDNELTYYWRIDARNTLASSEGFDWSFTTGDNSGVELINLALNQPVTCSSQENELHGVKNIVDGIVGRDCMRWSAESMPQWAEVDLGKNYMLSRTEVVCYLDRGYRFKVEVRADGSSEYTQVVDRLDNTDAGTIANPITDTFTNITGRYVRLTVVSGDSITYSGPWAGISEFRVFGVDAPSFIPKQQQFQSGLNLRNYPNPFDNSTTIYFNLPERGRVKVKIFNVRGEEIAELTDIEYPAGMQTLEWNAGSTFENSDAFGIYLCMIQYNNHIEVNKMVLLQSL